ncbi:MAG: FtsW/RodA/SpoVE family cell cycle protein [Lachnospiraceae bacterium]
MKEFLFDISKYIIAFLYIFYTVVSYRGTVIKSEEKRRYIYYFQVVMIFTIHIIGYGILYAAYEKIDYILLYIGQVFYFLVIITGYNVAYPKASKLLVNNMCMLLMTGFIIIGRIDSDSCLKQLIFATVGCIITFIVPVILKKMKSVRNYAILYGFAGLALLTALLFGNKVFGANLVLEIGDFSLQPTEFVKLLYVLFVAAMYNKSTSLKQIFVTSIVAAMHVIVLIISNDLGAALIFFVVYVAMIYVATKKFKFIVAGFLGGCVAAIAAYKLFAHVRVRVMAWLNPWADMEDKGYQITQSLFALGMGGWFGSGLTQGLPKAIPVVTKDMIFSAIGEEMGMIVAICVILICLNCFILMMNIASMCNTLFYRLLAVGLATCYGFQVFLTIGGATKFILLTGVTLPFVSYGGSSLISSFFLFALINGMYIMREEELGLERQKDRGNRKKNKTQKV